MPKFKESFEYFSKEVWPATVANVVGNDNVQRLTFWGTLYDANLYDFKRNLFP